MNKIGIIIYKKIQYVQLINKDDIYHWEDRPAFLCLVMWADDDDDAGTHSATSGCSGPEVLQ